MATAVGSGLGASLVFSRSARAFGAIPSGNEGVVVPEEFRAQNVLEVFLYGGVSQYETFYGVLDYGQADKTQWYAFFGTPEFEEALTSCNFTGDVTQPFAPDANGKEVSLGPFVFPLRGRPDVLERTRLLITSHDLAPHEAAIPLALTGRRLGNPTLAGLGAHIQRYYLDRGDSNGGTPFSYVLLPATPAILTNLTSGAVAVGAHPSSTRPLSIKIDASSDLSTLLQRGGVGGNRAAYDAMLKKQIERYNARLSWKGTALRAPHATGLSVAAGSMASVDAIQNVLAAEYLQPVQGSSCGATTETDTSLMNLRLAAHLLTHPTTPARYVCVIDGGLAPANDAGGYDAHTDCTRTTATNLTHTLRSLMDIVNKPGESDPNKLDLDKTLIIITTEFGRTPGIESSTGRGHWPRGYPVALIGGPVRKSNSGIVGACGPDGVATDSSSPAQNRIAALLALGIWPFEQDSFAVPDVPGAGTERDAAAILTKKLLGYG